MQAPSTVIQCNIDEILKNEAPKEFSDVFVEEDKGVALIDVKQYDEKLSQGVLVRIPKNCKYHMLDVVYFPHSTVILKTPGCDITLSTISRVLKDPKRANYLLKYRTNIELEILTNIIFELSRIDLNELYKLSIELFDINPHKTTMDLILREILNNLNTSYLSNSSDVLSITSNILKIYIRIKMKDKIKKGSSSISNENIEMILNLVDEYNSTKRSYKPIESFKKRLDEESVNVGFFQRILSLQGGLIGQFNKKLKLN